MSEKQDDFKTIQPRKVKLSHHLETDSIPSVEKKSSSLWLIALPLAALSAVVWIFFFLPAQVTKPVPVLPRLSPQPQVSAPQVPQPTPSIAPLQQLELERARKKTQETLARYVELQIELEDRMQVSEWGSERYAEYRELASRGDELFLEQKYADALAKYQEGITALEKLIAEGESRYQDALTRGATALAELDPENAQNAFESAAVIHPGRTEVIEGLKRSSVLPQVLELLEHARELADAGKLDEARATYEQAKKLDADTIGIEEALVQLEQRIRERDFKRHLSEGYAALSAGQYTRARASFNKALILRPDDGVVLDGLRQVKQNRKLKQISQLENKAKSLAEEEKWQQALAVYNDALKLDPALKFAKEGRIVSRQRIELMDRLNRAIEHPETLSSDKVYENTQTLYSDASSIENPGPELSRRLEKLAEILEIAAKPVQVTLVSDGQTQVVIQRVGPLGRFSSKSLLLRPGRYVFTGSRDGCRDVRKEIDISPGMPPFTIQCEETL